MNVSMVSDERTARTDPEGAEQRAEHLAILGVRSVIELCVGPSLMTMERAYARHGISVTGNDIDPRWMAHYPSGRWILGDALLVDPHPFDAVVFAPPLSRGCTGTREDSLMIDDVVPRYSHFLFEMAYLGYRGTIVMTLPARSLATPEDRRQLHALIDPLGVPYEAIPLVAERRRIRKYVDVYLGAGIQ